MKRKIIGVCAALALLTIAFWIGRASGINSASELQTKHDLELHKELVGLDQSFLTNVVTRPNTMTSGLYTLELQFAGKTKQVSELRLEFSDGKLVKPSQLPIQDIVQVGSVISWEQYDADEGSSTKFIGLIDGNVMWGRVYQEPGRGWKQGEPPAYGVWFLHPKSDK